MRATDLGFRSPKERTAEYINPVVTFDGRFLPLVHSNQTTTFSRSKRFTQYDQDAKRTGRKAGPGSYNLIQSPGAEWKIKGTPIYKDLHGSKDTGDNGYYFTGNSMVYEPSFVFNRRRSLRESTTENTVRDSVRRSASITDNEISFRALEENERFKKSQTVKINEDGKKTAGVVVNKSFVLRKRKFERKVSEQLRNSPYLAPKKALFKDKTPKPK